MGRVDDAVEDRLADHRVGEQRVPVGGLSVGRDDEGPVGPLAHQLVEVVGLGQGEIAHGEVVEDQHGGAGPPAKARLVAAIGVTAGQVRQKARRLGEEHLVAPAARGLSERLGHHGLAHTDGPVKHYGLAGVDEAQRGQVADLGGGDLGVEGEVELLDAGRLLEVGGLQPTLEPSGITTGRFVLAQHGEQLDVPEFAGGGLGEPGLDGLEHPEQLERAQCVFELVGLHRATSMSAGNVSNRAAGPCRWAGASGGTSGDSSASCSVPAAKMPFTVLSVGSPADRARAHAASRRSAPTLSARAMIPWAERSRYKALTSKRTSTRAVTDSPSSAAFFRHHAGVDWKKATFSGG